MDTAFNRQRLKGTEATTFTGLDSLGEFGKRTSKRKNLDTVASGRSNALRDLSM